ncbi:MAG: hypothetical protein ABIO04_00870 [Ferruginibacter sp.]
MSIVEAKRELFRELKKRNNAVTGAGIREKDGIEVIVIFITDPHKIETIPSTYKGNIVISEIITVPRPM